MKSFLIGAATSGCGKTTFTMGLLRALRNQGLRVQPFKCGPDYIDTKFHHLASGVESVNLDTFMGSRQHVRELFEHYGADADVCIIEGAMGLFDGYEGPHGSAAEVAALLDVPVILLVNARAVAYSVAPLIYGFRQFQPQLKLAGVVFNFVASERQYETLLQACKDAGVECLGYIGRNNELTIPSRHLGLDTDFCTQAEHIIQLAAGAVQPICEHLDLPAPNPVVQPQSISSQGHTRFVVARDEAFNFTYRAVIDAMRREGHVTFFSPLNDDVLPQGDVLYLPGGYPELYAQQLSANTKMRKAIHDYAEAGGRIIAECGGFMYLCRDIDNIPMCDVLPFSATMKDARLHLGYRTAKLGEAQLHGHEFHYSTLLSDVSDDPQRQPRRIATTDSRGRETTPIYTYKNVTAGYIHWYAIPSANPNQPLVPLAAKDVRQESNHQTALRPIMLAGTGSDVGKSVIATALCRIFVQDGYHPAPFKAQNMALNSYATPDGLEIGRAQAVQAEACRLAPHTDMNPLLLKPNSNHTTQVVLHGQPIGNRSAYDFWSSDAKGAGKGIDFRAEVCAAYDRLAARYAPIILEGAGSISEINLHDHDLVNLPMARHANAAVILVADIDRGGVFASCLGSIMLQSPEDRKRICGIIVNKFRGDLRLFDEGRRMLEHVCGVPVLGVVPQFEDIHIDAEDSVVMERRRAEAAKSGKPATSDAKSTSKRVAVCLLKHLSNFTDFDALERDPRATLFYTDKPEDLDDADIIIIPGTKATLDDLYHLRRSGMASAIMKAHSRGTLIIGICGGFQMLGQSVRDPLGIEGGAAEIPGLGLLPMQTTMEADKVTRQVEFTFRGVTCKGYEIHQGHSTLQEPIVEANGCMGTYIHGCFDNEAVRDAVLASPANVSKSESVDYLAERDRQYDLLAEHVRKHLDMEKIYEIIK